MGHNGSTILNLALSMSSDVIATSQLGDLLNPYDPRKSEDDIDDLWSDMLSSLSRETVDKIENLGPLIRQERQILRLLISRKTRKSYAAMSEKIIEEITRRYAPRIIVDSSKNISRAIALTECENAEVYIIHLVRDVRRLVNSYNKRRAEKGLRLVYLGPTIWWFLKNLSGSLLVPRFAKHYRSIRYEDMVCDPDTVVDTLEDFLGESLTQTRMALRGEINIESRNDIGFSGNRVMQQENRRFRAGNLKEEGVFRSNLYFYTLGWLGGFWGYKK